MKLIVAFICVLVSITGCSRVKSYFPDKEKDYQFSSEIPPLAIPGDLQSDKVDMTDPVEAAVQPQVSPELPVEMPVQPESSPDIPVRAPVPAGVEPSLPVALSGRKAQLLTYQSGVAYIHLSDTFERGWLLVSRAISHQSLEVIERNREQNYFSVLYDPDAKPISDGALVDELFFFLGMRESHEKEYHIRLVPSGGGADVIVEDKYNNPLAHGPGIILLQAIAEKINTDQDD